MYANVHKGNEDHFETLFRWRRKNAGGGARATWIESEDEFQG
jgi:hypothetical protein